MSSSSSLTLVAAAILTAAALAIVATNASATHDASVTAAGAGTSPATAVRLPLGEPTTGLPPRDVVPVRAPDLAATPPPVGAADDLVAASGTSSDPVDRGGRVVRFSVEVERATGLDADEVAAIVETALYDPRSWARDHDLRRVAPEDATLHLVVATPDRVDRICRRAGLRTLGWLSCWSGDTAAINLVRWQEGVEHVEDLTRYRHYVVNHEVGHGLGLDHRGCPGSGRTAPLMQQQTKGLDGCVANEWPYPDA